MSSSAVAVATSPAVASGMRVVILERDSEIRRKLQRPIDADQSFVLVGIAESWTECERQLQEYLPELLIAGADAIPLHALVCFSPSNFPVMLLSGKAVTEKCSIALAGLEERQIRQALIDARNEIYRRKGNQLSALIECYLEGNPTSGSYMRVLKAQDGDKMLELPVVSIILVAASGNYVRVHTGAGIFDIRETMTGISAKLDPVSFARVHRSYIVNLDYVCHLAQTEGIPTHVVLSNGTEVPIGPNYRQETIQLLNERLRQIA